MVTDDGYAKGRLKARPSGTDGEGPVGLRLLELDAGSDGYLYVPAGYGAGRPAPLALLLHGAGEDARDGLAQLRQQADGAGLILVALSSQGPTWDLILGRGRYGHDVAAIDEALGKTFSSYAVDPDRVAVGGYSDGASYAISLGISNGDLFGHVLAFSPGFMAPAGRVGSPRFFVSHGTRDRWLPIDRTSRRLVPELESLGYEVSYREFDGPHVVPPAIARDAVAWLTVGL
jgi:phospholipase/carboxylesterase